MKNCLDHSLRRGPFFGALQPLVEAHEPLGEQVHLVAQPLDQD
jgi:hypothetical protein